MATTWYFKHPNLFGTMTVNPKWLEIRATLLQGQKAIYQLDLVTYIFKFKSQTLFQNIIKSHVLGQIMAHVYTIEFQKQGLPHMHFFIFFAIEDKIIYVVAIDWIVCAKF